MSNYIDIPSKHARTFTIVLSTSTGSIMQQLCMAFNNQFVTVGSDHRNAPDLFSGEWYKMFEEFKYQYITDRIDESHDKDQPPEWLDVKKPLIFLFN